MYVYLDRAHAGFKIEYPQVFRKFDAIETELRGVKIKTVPDLKEDEEQFYAEKQK